MKICLLPLLALAACAAPVPVFKPVEVDVPVAMPCAALETLPQSELPQLAVTDSLFDKTRAMLIEIDRLRAQAALQNSNTSCP